MDGCKVHRRLEEERELEQFEGEVNRDITVQATMRPAPLNFALFALIT